MSTPPPDWNAVRAVFERAVPLDAAAREVLLADPQWPQAVVAEVRSLLANAEDSGGGFLAGAAAPPPVAREGQRLGAWRIVSRLGSGGMGEVWLAERADGRWQGEAAIKVVRRGMDSAAVLDRFAQEQQALARLAHPHIAHLLDAGRTDDGLPYFVMERVQGRPVDQACEGLVLEARLALFLQLADAVSHAHRQLLVHRDLKPGNVLVDAAGQVKLLDFGIAKALDAGADAGATQAGERPFTPLYASPEQVRGEPVGTATDVYSLGVLLYEMLTGVRPYGRGATSAFDAARAVLEDRPTRPSALPLQAVPDRAWAERRRRVEGDLDNIVLKALAKDTTQRYASVDALAEDVRRFLDGRPVAARSPTLAYVTAKFVRRHRAASALAAGLAISLVAGVAVSSWQAHQARERLAGIKSLTREAVFRFGDAVTYVPGGMAIKADLLQQLTSVLDRLAAAGGDDADLSADAAMAYARLAEIELNDNSAALSRAEAGRQHAARALELGRAALPAKMDDAEFLAWYWRALGSKARAQRGAGDPAAAYATLASVPALLGEGIAVGERAHRDDVVTTLRVERARARHLIAQMLYRPGLPHLDRPDDALATLALARAELQELDSRQHHPEITYLLGSVDGAEAIVHEAREALGPARAAAERALDARRRVVAELPEDVEYRDALVTEAVYLGRVLLRLQRDADALAATSLGWQVLRKLESEHPAGEGNAWTKRAKALALHHGRALRRNGRAAEALPLLEQAAGHWQAVYAAAPRNIDALRLQMGAEAERAQALVALGRAREAASLAADRFAAYGVPDAADRHDRRGARIARAELALAAAAAAPTEGAAWRGRAAAEYDVAAALLPLAGEHAAARAALR